jgi:SagB-type dehydrogenase family enzyme
MTPYPFALSLNAAIQVSAGADGYCLAPEGADTSPGVISSMVTLPSGSGMGDALAHLREGGATAAALVQTLVDRQGPAAGEQLAVVLQELDQRGWLNYAVLPLAIAVPLVETARLTLEAPHWSQAQVSVSRFAYQRSHGGGMVLESPLSKFRVKLLDWRASALVAQLAQPQPLRRLTPPPQMGPETAYQFLNLLWATGFLSVEAEAPELQLWEFHNLLFHSRSRQGRHDYPTGDIAASVGVWDRFPVVKPPMGGTIVPLPQFNIEAIRQRDKTLTTALEKRQSMREYDDHQPITVEQLGEFLYRTARIQEIYTLEAEQQALLKAEFGETFDWGELSRRPYPGGGAMYELEIYPVVRHCAGVNSGLYHYDPLNHHLVQVEAAEADIQALLQDAHQSSGAQGVPQVLLIITARFGRLFRKYRSLAYALVLKHVGVLYENFYLVATNMNLAPCALGAGDSDRFAQATGLDYIVESSVGEFMLGSRPNRALDPSVIEPPPPEQTVASETTVEPMEDRDMALSSDEPDQAASAAEIAQ